MQKHTKVYFKKLGFGDQDLPLCENCGSKSNDIHHLTFKSLGGKNNIENLMALCRKCHNEAHSNRCFNNRLRKIHLDYLKINEIIT